MGSIKTAKIFLSLVCRSVGESCRACHGGIHFKTRRGLKKGERQESSEEDAYKARTSSSNGVVQSSDEESWDDDEPEDIPSPTEPSKSTGSRVKFLTGGRNHANNESKQTLVRSPTPNVQIPPKLPPKHCLQRANGFVSSQLYEDEEPVTGITQKMQEQAKKDVHIPPKLPPKHRLQCANGFVSSPFHEHKDPFTSITKQRQEQDNKEKSMELTRRPIPMKKVNAELLKTLESLQKAPKQAELLAKGVVSPKNGAPPKPPRQSLVLALSSDTCIEPESAGDRDPFEDRPFKGRFREKSDLPMPTRPGVPIVDRRGAPVSDWCLESASTSYAYVTPRRLRKDFSTPTEGMASTTPPAVPPKTWKVQVLPSA